MPNPKSAIQRTQTSSRHIGNSQSNFVFDWLFAVTLVLIHFFLVIMSLLIKNIVMWSEVGLSGGSILENMETIFRRELVGLGTPRPPD